MRLVQSPLTEEIINQVIKVVLLVLGLIPMLIWILRLTAELIKVMIILLQILDAMGIREIRENVIFTFTEARLLAADCCVFMVILPKR